MIYKKQLVFISVLFLWVGWATIAQEIPCSDFKEGYFKSTDPTGTMNMLIHRTADIQIEYGIETGWKAKISVNWIDECTYALQVKELLSDPMEVGAGVEDVVIKVEITNTTPEYYTQRSTSEQFDDKVMETDVYKITEQEFLALKKDFDAIKDKSFNTLTEFEGIVIRVTDKKFV